MYPPLASRLSRRDHRTSLGPRSLVSIYFPAGLHGQPGPEHLGANHRSVLLSDDAGSSRWPRPVNFGPATLVESFGPGGFSAGADARGDQPWPPALAG